MFDTVDGFLAAWADESRQTRRVLDAVGDERMAWRGHARARSVGELAWHLVTALTEIGGRAGLRVEGPGRDAPAPATVAEVVEAYIRAAAAVDREVRTHFVDTTLTQTDDVYGMEWPRGKTLFVLVGHEIHHRAQLGFALRLAGDAVPGVYGPSADETA